MNTLQQRHVVRRSRPWETQVVNALLAEIDGVEGQDGVILLAACNHATKRDPVLVRSGRLDQHVRIRLPERADLEQILREHLAGDLAEVPLSGVTLAAIGSSGADCERIVRGARRIARDVGRAMSFEDVTAGISGTDDRAPAELWFAAVHEAGHAVASCEWHPGGLEVLSLQSVATSGVETIVRRNERFLHARDVTPRLAELLAGRASEEVFSVTHRPEQAVTPRAI